MAIKISVIIPVYNAEKYLKECLDSVKNQTLKEIEIICIDDGSTDKSLEILREYADKDSRFVVLEQKNSGAGEARNAGLKIAEGEYLSFLDSDDFFELEMFAEMYQKAKNTNADIVLCAMNTFENDTKIIKNNRHYLPMDILGNFDVFSQKDISDIFCVTGNENWSKLYKKDFIITNGIKFQNIKTCNDLYFSRLALSLAEKITYINKPFINYRVNTKSSVTSSRGNFYKNIFVAFEALKNSLQQKNILSDIEKSFYGLFVSALHYEYEFIKETDKKTFLAKCEERLPQAYFQKLIDKINGTFAQKIFSITNQHINGKKVKILMILGRKIKLNRGR